MPTCRSRTATSNSQYTRQPHLQHETHTNEHPRKPLATALLLTSLHTLPCSPLRFQLSYWPVSDKGIFEPHILQARVDKEAGSARTWKRALQQHNISSLRDLHAWLHATHLCYSVSRQHEFGQPTELSPELAASY
jgi:hypothetical protein